MAGDLVGENKMRADLLAMELCGTRLNDAVKDTRKAFKSVYPQTKFRGSFESALISELVMKGHEAMLEACHGDVDRALNLHIRYIQRLRTEIEKRKKSP